jgi:hypothetical protein
MPKKKTTPNEKQFIAYDELNDALIWVGPLKGVVEAVEDYIHVEDLTLDEAESNVHIYELGQKKRLEVYPGKLEVVVIP